jgi:hypothetical protein
MRTFWFWKQKSDEWQTPGEQSGKEKKKKEEKTT